jgi:glucose-1-phosphate adenylyltransferase
MSRGKEEILAMVMAGGRGERLYPLTLERTKPSVPFGGKYRIIDFALSNLINSGIYSIYVLVQYKSQSLIEHIRTTWSKGGVLSKHFITVVPPQMRKKQEWYRGTADSIYQNINLVYDFKPKLVAIFAGDHIYRMNIREMIDYHLKKKSHLTVSIMPVEAKYANQFGIVNVDHAARVKKFEEKPFISGTKTVFASMGNYIFDTDFLIDTLEEDAKRDTGRDFGKDIIPYLTKKHAKIYAYDFSKNRIPSLNKYEDHFYWKDVGTIASYWQANMDLLGCEPKLDLDNQSWPIYASNLDSPPARIIDSEIENSLICEGAKISGAKIKNSIIARSVKIEPGCLIEDSIIMDFTHINKSSHIRKAIIDRFNNIPKDSRIGYSKKDDSKNYYLDACGITVVMRGSRKAFYF